MIAVACANPVEIEGDVLIVDPSAFGENDAGVPPAAGNGGGGGAGGVSAGGGAGGAAGAGTGFAAGGTASGFGMQAAAETSPLPADVSGTSAGLGGAASLGGAGGEGGAPASAGGAASFGGAGGVGGGTAPVPAEGAASAETATSSVFDPAACDFQNVVGCEDLDCLQACPANDSGSCSTRCQALITCVSTDPQCTITPEDPLCAARVGGAVAACTQEADSAGGANTTQTTQPAFVARQFVQCICSVPRPG
jgi:hypothetical protein